MNPDQSTMPVGGSARRTGARIGSVAWMRNAETWFRPVGSIHDISIRPSTITQSAMSKNWMNVRRKARPTAGSLPSQAKIRAETSWPVTRMVRMPLAEQGASDADDRGALLDRDFEIGRAHV